MSIFGVKAVDEHKAILVNGNLFFCAVGLRDVLNIREIPCWVS